jgi:primosomal protein N' (replication factor Y)
MLNTKDLFYYRVAIASKNIKLINDDLPVYHSYVSLGVGQVVTLSYRKRKLKGMIIKEAAKPKFNTKPVEATRFKLSGSTIELARQISEFYCVDMNQAISLFVPSDVNVASKPESRSTVKKQTVNNFKLSVKQEEAFNAIKDSKSNTIILAGETGSGKSYIYLSMVMETIENGGSAIILTPEISLSPQMIDLFKSHVSAPIFHISSSLTKSQRRRVWQEVYNSPQAIIIGPRSSLFLPVNNLKLMIIDEFHESTYKNDSAPKYNTQAVASLLSGISNARLVLGSATPRVQDVWIAKKKNIPVIKLPKPKVNSTNLSLINQNDNTEFTKSKILSNTAVNKIKLALNNRNQILIFHNQRGTARALICTKCEWIYKCQSCGSNLIFHHTKNIQTFSCHTCSKTYNLKARCANGHDDVKLIGFGTKRIVEELKRLFPESNIIRIDTDQKNIEEKLSLINQNKVEIIVGTQMLAKGHNFKNLTLVVVPLADTGLGSYDFTAQEKTYQLLHQVIGRVGRFDHPGEVVLQSFNPYNKIIQLASNGSFEQFFDYEIRERQLSMMPPFSFALKISVIYQKEDYANTKLKEFISKLDNQLTSNIRILGPSPASQKLVSGKHKVQMIILSQHRIILQKIIYLLPYNFNYDIDPVNFM